MSNNASMTSESWERVKTIFHDALAVEDAQRDAFVREACGNDTEILSQLQSLLAAHEQATEFLETPAVALVGDLPAFRDNSARERIGPYRLIREIGRGGMGTVYLASRDDGQFTQRVAIKVIKRGMDSDAIVARFRQERQIVAALEHPNIARLFDGGTSDDGVPYFVMEYVEGESIRDYCRSHSLNVKQRLELFRTVCAAVQFAHQNLVVHRDIKSSNVIVNKEGVPKLLDFGIAKVLQPTTAEAHATRTETVSAMTPEYASPEQLRGDPVTTATDVYSLGVLLYELLTGVRPFDVSTLRGEALVRVVSDTAPKPPSVAITSGPISNNKSGIISVNVSPASTMVAVTAEDARAISRELRGDLDTIVLMALRKEAQRRYSSVERFADDISRYLENRPVAAQRDTFSYRATKFAQRNRASISVAALLMVTLVAGIGATFWQARIAETERARAERRFSEIRSLATRFIFDVHDSIVPLAGSTPVRAMLVKQGLASLDGLAKEAEGDSLLERELSSAYQRMGLVLGNSYNANLGDTKAALASYRTAAKLLDRSTDTSSRNTEALIALAQAKRGLADVLVVTGEVPEAIVNLEYAHAALRRALILDSSNFDNQRILADLLYVLGDTYGGLGYANMGDTKRAVENYKAAIAMRESMLKREPKNDEARGGLANALMNLGSLELSLDDTVGSARIARSVRILEDLTAEHPDDAVRQNALLSAYLRQRRPLADAGQFTPAMIADHKVLGILEGMVKADPTNTLLQRNLGVTYNTLGFDLVGAGRASEAVLQHRKALAIASKLAANDPASLEMKQDLSYTQNALGDALRESGQLAAAIDEYNRSLGHKVALRKLEPENPRHESDLVYIYGGRGAAYTETGNFAAAERDLKDAVQVAEKLVAAPDATNRTRNNVAMLYGRVGHLHAKQSAAAGSPAARATSCTEARRWLQRSLDSWAQLQSKKQMSGANRALPGKAKIELQKCST